MNSLISRLRSGARSVVSRVGRAVSGARRAASRGRGGSGNS